MLSHSEKALNLEIQKTITAIEKDEKNVGLYFSLMNLYTKAEETNKAFDTCMKAIKSCSPDHMLILGVKSALFSLVAHNDRLNLNLIEKETIFEAIQVFSPLLLPLEQISFAQKSITKGNRLGDRMWQDEEPEMKKDGVLRKMYLQFLTLQDKYQPSANAMWLIQVGPELVKNGRLTPELFGLISLYVLNNISIRTQHTMTPIDMAKKINLSRFFERKKEKPTLCDENLQEEEQKNSLAQ